MGCQPFSSDGDVYVSSIGLISSQDIGKRDFKICICSPTFVCVCFILQPFDETYLKSCDPPIKFLSFHSYIRKLRSGVDKYVIFENYAVLGLH